MKILPRDQFLALTGEVLFSRLNDNRLTDVEIKSTSTNKLDEYVLSQMGPKGFLLVPLVGWVDGADDLEQELEMIDQGMANPDLSIPMIYTQKGADSEDDPEQLFAVYEPADVQKLIQRLQALM